MRYLLLLLLLTACAPQNGTDGKTGAQGNIGPMGPSGNPGLQGPAGINGTVITLIQFCPGTPSYPSTFPEVGMCINNQIYAVYSANDGFLTLIPPGTYNSNAIGSTCSFQVLPDCQVMP